MFRSNAVHGITQVRYNVAHTHIERVRVRDPILNTTIELTRSDVVSRIKQGYQFRTMPQDWSGQYRWGEDVRIFRVNGDEFLRTDTNGIARDNLGNLPEY
jgi:hypothetical protein